METNQEKSIDLLQIAKFLWYKRRKIIYFAVIGAFIGAIISISIPREYATNVKLAPESKNKTTGNSSMQSLAGMMGVNIGVGAADGINVKMYPTIINTTPFIMEFYDMEVSFMDSDRKPERLNSYLNEYQKSPWWTYILKFPGALLKLMRPSSGSNDDVPYMLSHEQHRFISNLSSRIYIGIDKDIQLINIGVRMQDPLVAAIVADSVVSKLQRYMINYSTSKAKIDLDNTLRLYQDAYARYDEAQQNYAAVMDKNRDLMSEKAKASVRKYQSEYDVAFSVYQQMASQMEIAKLKLQEETPVLTVVEPSRLNNAPISPKRVRIVIGFSVLLALGYCSVIAGRMLMADMKDTEKVD